MRRYLIAIAACCWGGVAYADSCPLPAPESKSISYDQGTNVAVITGPYQFNMPQQPNALLAFDGVMAVLPDHGYVSYQLISNDAVAGVLAKFSNSSLSASGLDRYIYGLDSIEELPPKEQLIVRNLRSDLRLDCHSRLTRYIVGGAVEVIFQRPSANDPVYRLLYFSGELTHLISVKGTEEQAFAVLKSIKRRKL